MKFVSFVLIKTSSPVMITTNNLLWQEDEHTLMLMNTNMLADGIEVPKSFWSGTDMWWVEWAGGLRWLRLPF